MHHHPPFPGRSLPQAVCAPVSAHLRLSERVPFSGMAQCDLRFRGRSRRQPSHPICGLEWLDWVGPIPRSNRAERIVLSLPAQVGTMVGIGPRSLPEHRCVKIRNAVDRCGPYMTKVAVYINSIPSGGLLIHMLTLSLVSVPTHLQVTSSYLSAISKLQALRKIGSGQSRRASQHGQMPKR